MHLTPPPMKPSTFKWQFKKSNQKKCNISIGQKILMEMKHAYQPPPTTSLPPCATRNLTKLIEDVVCSSIPIWLKKFEMRSQPNAIQGLNLLTPNVVNKKVQFHKTKMIDLLKVLGWRGFPPLVIIPWLKFNRKSE